MIIFLCACLWLVLGLFQVLAGFVFRIFAGVFWLFWPLVVVGALVASAQPCEAGWLSWPWGSESRHLERSLKVAQEAARVASEASQAQAQQAAAHADQNARLAETLGQLSSERSNLADHLHALTELGLRDSQWAAAINASGPVLVSCAVLLVAGLALWLANKSGEGQHAELAETVEMLVEEIAAHASDPVGLPDEPYGASVGPLRLGQHRRNSRVALVGYTGEAPDGPGDGEQDGERMPF